eukprot:SAG22_NODE_5637_length_979_cov_1.037500_1_plen_101_part_00
MGIMDELEGEMAKVKEAKAALKETQLTIDSNKEELRELTNSKAMLERAVHSTNDKIVRVTRDGERDMQEAQTRLNSKQQVCVYGTVFCHLPRASARIVCV